MAEHVRRFKYRALDLGTSGTQELLVFLRDLAPLCSHHVQYLRFQTMKKSRTPSRRFKATASAKVKKKVLDDWIAEQLGVRLIGGVDYDESDVPVSRALAQHRAAVPAVLASFPNLKSYEVHLFCRHRRGTESPNVGTNRLSVRLEQLPNPLLLISDSIEALQVQFGNVGPQITRFQSDVQRFKHLRSLTLSRYRHGQDISWLSVPEADDYLAMTLPCLTSLCLINYNLWAATDCANWPTKLNAVEMRNVSIDLSMLATWLNMLFQNLTSLSVTISTVAHGCFGEHKPPPACKVSLPLLPTLDMPQYVWDEYLSHIIDNLVTPRIRWWAA
ncbi:hypothetical protein OIV83_003862 [Microbotryomycetes sp. JL201]|nr:hypothetical protein OIV83_003862 [Microbotryomycetes sp. JL201]